MWLRLLAQIKPNCQPLCLLGFAVLLNIVLQFPSVEDQFNAALDVSDLSRQELVCGETASFERPSPSHTWVIGSSLVAVSSASSQVNAALVPIRCPIVSPSQIARKTISLDTAFFDQWIVYRISGLAPPLV